MHNTLLLVKVFQSLCHLQDDVSTQVLAEVRQADNLMEEFATRAQFKDDEVVLTRLGKRDELHNVGMIELAHNLNLFQNVGTLDEGCVSYVTRPLHEDLRIVKGSCGGIKRGE